MTDERQRQWEEKEYLSRVITDERPICWWCINYPTHEKAELCKAWLDHLDVMGMGRKWCTRFELNRPKLGFKDETAKNTSSHMNQLELDFGG
jgi:hypothetical protein